MKKERHFPVALNKSDAQRIINSTSRGGIFRDKLIKKWAEDMVNPDLDIYVDYNFYKELRESSIDTKLLDDLFGSDLDISNSKYKIGDYVTLRSIDFSPTIVTGVVIDINITPSNNIRYSIECRDDRMEKAMQDFVEDCENSYSSPLTDINPKAVYHINEGYEIINPTKQEIKSTTNKKSPYKEKQLCWVFNRDKTVAYLKYAVGDISSNGQPLFYDSQINLDKNEVQVYPHHEIAKGIKLPKF